MISTKTIIDKANAKITAGLTEEEIMQLSVINDSITKSKFTVAFLGDLPSAGDNAGRLAYVEENFSYYFSDGVVWLNDFKSVLEISAAAAWGNNSGSKLGTVGLAGERSSPTMVSGGITNWSVVSAGWDHSLGLTLSGIIYTWGAGSSGQLGNGLGSGSVGEPVTVVGGITNWSAGSAGRFHSLGLRANGVIYAWGRGANGQLGDGTAINRSSPVIVVGGITNWSTISAGRYFSLGLTNTGVLYAWGAGASGRLGDGTAISRSSPVTVVGGITNWSAISAVGGHSLGLTSSGVLYAWGENLFGTLGDGTTINKSSPVTVVGGITNWSAVSAGGYHSLALTDTGVLYAWGLNNNGQLGTNEPTFLNKSSPVTVVVGITNWSAISAGDLHSLGLTNTGVIYAWGAGSNGRLGNNSTISRSSPVTVVGGITSWSQISAGLNHSLAIYQIQKGFNEP
jgi:alpha-tubulin suppressor-like RCC1 family protein